MGGEETCIQGKKSGRFYPVSLIKVLNSADLLVFGFPPGCQAVVCSALSSTLRPFPCPPSEPCIISMPLHFMDRDVVQHSIKLHKSR